MYGISRRMRGTLKTSHTPFIVVKILARDGRSYNIPVVKGEVQIDRQNQEVRRTLSFTTNDETLIPLGSDDPLNIYANYAFVYRGVLWDRSAISQRLWDAPPPLTEALRRPADGSYELVPLGVFRLNEVSISEKSDGELNISVKATDISGNIGKNRWTQPITVWTSNYELPVQNVATTGFLVPTHKFVAQTYSQAIRLLITDRWLHSTRLGPPRFDFSGIHDKALKKPVILSKQLATTPSGGSSPWSDCVELAGAIGCELYFDSEGSVRLKEVVDPNTVQPSWEFLDGPGGLLIGVDRSISDSKIANYVVATGQNTSTSTTGNPAPLKAVAKNMDASSPTYWNGGFGTVVVNEPGRKKLSTQAEVNLAAQTYLRWFTGAEEQVSIEGVVNPALDVGDVVMVRRRRVGIYDREASAAETSRDLKGGIYNQTPISEIPVVATKKIIPAGTRLSLTNNYANQEVVLKSTAQRGSTTLHIEPVTLKDDFRKFTIILHANASGNGSVPYLIDSLTVPLDLETPMSIKARARVTGTTKDAIQLAEFSDEPGFEPNLYMP